MPGSPAVAAFPKSWKALESKLQGHSAKMTVATGILLTRSGVKGNPKMTTV